MTENRLDQLTSVAISQRIDGQPSFLLLLTKEGTVQRMGYSTVFNREKTLSVVEDASVFERFVDALPSDVLSHAGSQEVEGMTGMRAVCRIELASESETATYEMTYSSGVGGLPRYMQLMVDLGEDLTDEWYGGTLPLTAVDLPPMQAGTSATPAPPAAYEPPPPPPPAYEPPPAPAYETPVEEEPESGAGELESGVDGELEVGAEQYGQVQRDVEFERDVEVGQDAEAGSEAEQGAEAEADPTMAAPGAGPQAPPAGPSKASVQRLALAVVLDLLVITSAYGMVTLMLGRGLPLGAALFFLVITEVCLILLLRWSPGYWLLGMRVEDGVLPTVGSDQRSRESLVTHIVATVLLASGLESLTVWSQYQDPIPYFGFGWGMWFAVIVSFLIGAAYIASSVLIFRNDLRGVWVGAGVTAFSFLSIWMARGRALNGWLRFELMQQAEAEGTPIADPLELDPVLGMVVPLAFVMTVATGVGLYFVWRRFEKPGGAVAEV